MRLSANGIVGEQASASVALQAHGENAVTTHSDTLIDYYVIIGCGTAAVVNHTTLRQTEWGKARIGSLPVMHIGFKDPWSDYFDHGMGQPPYLLTMPGYQTRPNNRDVLSDDNPGCSSKAFGKCTDDEWQKLKTKYEKINKFHHINGWVAVIQKKATPMSRGVIETITKLAEDEGITLLDNGVIGAKLKEPFKSQTADYRLVVIVPISEDTGTLKFVYAQKVDICTGAGRARNKNERDEGWMLSFKKFCNEAKTKLFIPPELWKEETLERKFITGPEALINKTVWNKTDRVFVTSGGGIGLNMVERGEGEKCFGDWIYKETLHATFNLPRNDTVLLHPDVPKRRMKEGESDIRTGPFQETFNMDIILTPAIKTWRIGKYTMFKSCEIDGDKVSLGLTFKAGKTAIIRDFFGKNMPLDGRDAFLVSNEFAAGCDEHHFFGPNNRKKYDRICFINGLDVRELGEPYTVAPVNDFRFTEIFDANHKLVALMADLEKVRILGAAAQGHPSEIFKLNRKANNATSTYFNTLPLSAIVPGFIFSGINVALANQYFDGKIINPNVNTTTQIELGKWIKEEAPNFPYPGNLALQVVKHRRFTNGFKDTDAIMKALQDEPELNKFEGWQQIIPLLQTNYPEARELLEPQS